MLETNEVLAKMIIDAIQGIGVTEVCLCAGARCAPLVFELEKSQGFKVYHWFEERSAAFFAMGASRRLGNPVAVITTSGTAAGELLPAMMESYYSGVPLLAITADRPRRFRGTGAPQSAEQVGLFGVYAQASFDIAAGEPCIIENWNQAGPAHLNVCFEDPNGKRQKNYFEDPNGRLCKPSLSDTKFKKMEIL